MEWCGLLVNLSLLIACLNWTGEEWRSVISLCFSLTQSSKATTDRKLFLSLLDLRGNPTCVTHQRREILLMIWSWVTLKPSASSVGRMQKNHPQLCCPGRRPWLSLREKHLAWIKPSYTASTPAVNTDFTNTWVTLTKTWGQIWPPN